MGSLARTRGETYAVVLAGGMSRRFGGDKLSAAYRNEPVISRVCRAASGASDGVYLSVRTKRYGQRLTRVAPGLVAGVVLDSEPRCLGPVKGFVTAARELGCARLLFLPGDLPRLEAVVLRRLITLSGGHEAASIIWGSGMVESLIQLHRRTAAKVMAEDIARLRGKEARPTDLLRGAGEVKLIHAKKLTSDPFVLSNLNRRSDLVSPEPRGDFDGAVSGDVLPPNRSRAIFWEAARAFAAGRFARASELYELEGQLYSAYGVHHLAGHCLSDASSSAKGAGDLSRASLLAEASRASLERMGAGRPIRPRLSL